MAKQPGRPPLLFNQDADWVGYVLDSRCVAWMFKVSIDTDVIMAILRFIPEVVWYAGVYIPLLEGLYNTLVDCFDRSSGHPIVTPKLKDKAYLAAKAFSTSPSSASVSMMNVTLMRSNPSPTDTYPWASKATRVTPT